MEQKDEKIIVLFAGGSASGKTKICERVVKELVREGHEEALNVELDGFYHNPPEGVSGEDHNWDHPDAFDWKLLADVLTRLKRGESVWLPEHDFENYCQIEKAKFVNCAGKVILVNGLYTLHNPIIRNLADYKVFVECDSDIALMRRAIRDERERGYSFEITTMRYTKHVKPAFHEHIEPTRKYADIYIPNQSNVGVEKNIGVDILIEFLKTRL